MKAIIVAAVFACGSFLSVAAAHAATITFNFAGTIQTTSGDPSLTAGGASASISGYMQFNLPTDPTSSPYFTTGDWYLWTSSHTGYGNGQLSFDPAKGSLGQSDYDASVTESNSLGTYIKSELYLFNDPSLQSPYGFLILRSPGGLSEGRTDFSIDTISANTTVTPIPATLLLFVSGLCALAAIQARQLLRPAAQAGKSFGK